MSDVPELTDDEATVLRSLAIGVTARDLTAMKESDLCGWDSGTFITKKGLTALAAYDAKQRAKIRVEAMRECEEMLRAIARQPNDDAGQHCLGCFLPKQEVADFFADDIRALIAKEPSNGLS